MSAAESLLGEVEEKRKKTIQMLESEYSAKKEEVTKKTAEQMAYIQESSRREAAVAAQREKVRISGAAKLQSKKLMFDATEKMLEANVAALRQVLAEYASSKDYPDLLAKMVAYANKRLGGSISVVCRAEDVATMKKHNVRITSSDLESMGGFKATSKDGTLELDLTFEELLRGREEDARALLLGKE